MHKSCELHLHSVKHKYLCCSILLWKTDLIHYILRIIAAPYRKIKCTADSCGHLSCKKKSFYSTYPGANIGNSAFFMDSEKVWQIFTHFLCNTRENRRGNQLILFYLNILSCTVLYDPDLLKLLKPCLILIISIVPLTSVLKCLQQVAASVQTEESSLLVKHY